MGGWKIPLESELETSGFSFLSLGMWDLHFGMCLVHWESLQKIIFKMDGLKV